MADLTPTTELQAVNEMLDTIGESPVNTLEQDDDGGDLGTAKRILHSVSRYVQARGLAANTEVEYPLTRDQDNKIPVPQNALAVDASDIEGADVDVVVRGSFLYDRKNHRYTFERNLKVDIAFFLPFAELPEAVRAYITVRASRLFHQKVLGSDSIQQNTEKDERDMWAALLEAEGLSADYNVLTGSSSVARVLNRYPNQ